MRLVGVGQASSPDDAIDGRRTELMPASRQQRLQLPAGPPVHLPQLDDHGLHALRRLGRRGLRTSGLIDEALNRPLRLVALEPLIGRRRADSEGSTERAHIRPALPRRRHEPNPLLLHIGLQPGHLASSSKAPYPDLLTMS